MQNILFIYDIIFLQLYAEVPYSYKYLLFINLFFNNICELMQLFLCI
jgi:hypothetical protein